MKRYPFCLALVWSIVLTQWAAAQRSKDGPDPAELVPADALAYVGITDVQALWTDIKGTTDYRRAQDKELADTSGGAFDLVEAARKFKERLAEALDTEADQLDNPFAGPLAIYVAAPPGAALEDAQLVIIAHAAEGPLLRQYFDVAVAKFKEVADTYETEEAAGVTLHVFASKTDEENGDSADEEMDFEGFEEGTGIESVINDFFSADSLPPKFVTGLADNRLVLSTSVEGARTALERRDRSASLAGTDDYRALLQELKPTGDVRLLVNLPRLIEMAKAEAAGDSDFQQTMSFVGASSLRSAVGHLRLGTKSYDYKFEMLFLMSGQRSGLAKLLSMENRPVTPAATVPANTAIYTSLNVDPPGLLEEILRMIAQQNAEAAEALRASLAAVPMPDGQPIDLPNEVLNHLTGPLTLSFGFTRPYGPGSLRLLGSLGQRDRDALVRAASRLPIPPPREFQGAQIFENPGSPVQLALSDNHLLAGTAAAIEAMLTGDESAPLMNDASFKRAARLVPKEAWWVLYIDQHKLLEAFMELSKKGPELMADPALGGMMMGLSMVGVDFSDIPPRMLDYTAPAMMTIATTSEGVRVTLVSLKPDKEK